VADLRPDASKARRLAIANLLRIADTDLSDARLVLRRGQGRNAAALGSRALANLIRALAASENGWPLGAWDDGADAVPSANPFRHDLLATEVRLADDADQRVDPDGHVEPAPENANISDALDHVEDILDAASQAFGVDLSGEGPAANADPVRPAPDGAEEPLEKQDSPAGDAGDPSTAEEPRPDREELPEQDVKPAVSTAGISARRPRHQSSASAPKPEPEPAVAGKQLAKAVIVRRKPPRQPPKGDRRALPPLKSIIKPPSAKKPSNQSQATDAASDPANAAVGHGVSEQAVHHGSHDYPSTVFWALMDRWKLSDAEALDLIGHPGGLTKKGTRPRFRVVGEEARLFGQLQEIESALSLLAADTAAWMRRPIRDAPFRGQSPISYITRNGLKGARAVARQVLMAGLQQRTPA
jgi:hypothetical protein